VTVPILEGLDGVERMSKSKGNYIGVDEAPREMFGKIMSLPDASILRYFELATDVTPEELDAIRARLDDTGTNPRDVKVELGKRLVGMYHSVREGEDAAEEFFRVFREGGVPDSMPEVRLGAENGELGLVPALCDAGLVKSRGDARRMIRQRAVRVDGERIEDENHVLAPREDAYQVQVGKRSWAKILVEP
jgi:tyrosyl-tRNA synthetase